MTTAIMMVMKVIMFLLIMMMKHLPGNDTVNHCSPISDHKQPSVNINVNINISANINVHGCIFDDVRNEELGF